VNRILIVEDDPALLRGLRDNLAYESYDVVTAADGERAYRLIHDTRPDLIVMDVMLPGMWGDELCRRVRAEGLTTPIVMLTARADESDRVDGLDGGADDYVSKPFAIRELSARIRSILRNRRESAGQHQRLVHDLRVAADVQRRLLPQTRPALRTLDCAGMCRPAQAVGGDYFDHLIVGDDHVALIVADVAGKGMPAALLMASLHGHLRAKAPVFGVCVNDALASVNEFLYREADAARYATLCYAVYDDRTRRVRYVNAGHPPPIVIGPAEGVRALAATAPPAGLFEQVDCECAELQLHSEEWLIICSDGITEAASSRGEEFGSERLVDVARSHRHECADRMCQAILEAVESFAAGAPQADDMTVLAARVR
jgi:sigma-B regulation protein RsbU (phosphoserine phosphatase)